MRWTKVNRQCIKGLVLDSRHERTFSKPDHATEIA